MNDQKIIPHLWFDKEAKEAVRFYRSVFEDSAIHFITQIPDTPSGDAELVGFQLMGYHFMAISAGPLFKINPSISFHVRCRTVEEVERIWKKLCNGGTVMMEIGEYPFSKRYGWIQDIYGVSWQIIPANMEELLCKNPVKTTPVMLGMKKIIIADLEKAGEE